MGGRTMMLGWVSRGRKAQGRDGRTIVTEFVLVQDAGCALVRYVCYPYAADADFGLLQALIDFVP